METEVRYAPTTAASDGVAAQAHHRGRRERGCGVDGNELRTEEVTGRVIDDAHLVRGRGPPRGAVDQIRVGDAREVRVFGHGGVLNEHLHLDVPASYGHGGFTNRAEIAEQGRLGRVEDPPRRVDRHELRAIAESRRLLIGDVEHVVPDDAGVVQNRLDVEEHDVGP